MKKNILLKNLIDLLFILMIPGIIGFLIVLPFGMFDTTVNNITVSGYEELMELPSFYWIAVITAMISYFFLLIALWFLKKAARHFLNNKLLREEVSIHLNRSGSFLIATAIGTFLCYIALWFANLEGSGLSIQYGNNIFIPLFLSIIGLFFRMIANTLHNARLLKEENDLTI